MRFILGTSLILLFSFCQTTLAGIFQESGYTQVFILAIQDGSIGYNVNAIPYSLDISDTIADGSFSRIAYYMELDGAYVWVSMDAFTADASEIGVPSRGPNGNGNNVFQPLALQLFNLRVNSFCLMPDDGFGFRLHLIFREHDGSSLLCITETGWDPSRKPWTVANLGRPRRLPYILSRMGAFVRCGVRLTVQTAL